MQLKVVFRNNQQQKLIGALFLPEGIAPHPAVVLVHGFAASKDMFFFPELTESLVQAGYAVLGFDARACGESEGEFHPSFLSLAADIEAAVSFLAKRQDIGPIAVLGHSMGGTSSILAGKHMPQVHAIVVYGAVADTEKTVKIKREEAVLHENYYIITLKDKLIHLGQDFFNDASKVELYKEVRTLNKPLLIVQGLNDTRVDSEQAIQLFLQASMPKSIKKISHCDHWFVGHESTLIESTIDFLERWIRKKEE